MCVGARTEQGGQQRDPEYHASSFANVVQKRPGTFIPVLVKYTEGFSIGHVFVRYKLKRLQPELYTMHVVRSIDRQRRRVVS